MIKLETLFFYLVISFFYAQALGQDFPEKPVPPRLVSDFAEILSSSERKSLENKLSNYDDTTSTQIAIVTLKSLGGYEVAEYSFELAERWGIGQEGKDNGILILVAIDDRKLWIATGYGLEEFVPDAMANRIVDRTLRPNFRNNNFYRGLDEATSILMSLLSGQFIAEPQAKGLPIGMFIIAMLIFLIIIYLISRRGKGGGRGGGMYPTARTFGNPYRGGSTWTDFSSGSGSFGGFGGGGGSFGGFGGGSFGGGGAGGSW